MLRLQILRRLVELLITTLYRVATVGRRHVPAEGAALLVANHPSFLDALIVGGMSPRPVRFVMYHRMFALPGLSWFFRAVRAIPIAPRKEDPVLLEQAYDAIDRALAEGELVCIFPEGKCSRDGGIDVFRPGVERILARRPVPVVPVAIRGMWGSFFSYFGGKPMRKRPQRFWSRIAVAFGRPLEPEGLDAAVLRECVVSLHHAADCSSSSSAPTSASSATGASWGCAIKRAPRLNVT